MSILTGCLYPKENMKQNAVPYEDQLQVVQKAVATFKEQNDGILPIKTRDMNTPIYQKYPIDFQRFLRVTYKKHQGMPMKAGSISIRINRR